MTGSFIFTISQIRINAKQQNSSRTMHKKTTFLHSTVIHHSDK